MIITTYNKAAITALTFLIASLVCAGANAANHALLIGIGQYHTRTLEGPPHDVAALRSVLASKYDFKRENIRALINQEAVKSRILNEIKQLAQITQPGDRIFIYFSGHGTSRRDDRMSLPLPHGSGALVPADFSADPNQTIEELMSQLIVGKRDLRPMLARLDLDRQVLMVFDTCFSGNTVRAIGATQPFTLNRYFHLASRSVFNEELTIGRFEDNLIHDEPYPYQNIFYISASSENEIAKDIQQDMLYLYPTIDGKPHGALTDSLLRVLAGQVQVDTDNDGEWSQIELYTALRFLVQQRFKQTPQALPTQGAGADNLHARAFFVRSGGGLSLETKTSPSSKLNLRVRVVEPLSLLETHISKIEGVIISNDDPDLIVTQDGNATVLALPNMHPLCRFTSFDIDLVVDRIRRHLRIQPLINLVYPRQQFNVEIEISGSYQKSIIAEDETFGFEIRTARQAYLLLIDVDPSGAVHVLYPFDKSELQPLVPGEKKVLTGKCRAIWPFGTESVKLFAFTHKPDALESFVGKEDIHPDSLLFNDLERLVGVRGLKSSQAAARTDAAQAALNITSYPKTDMRR
ncbi:MAG: caspase family protein [Desulfobacterales bacterium]